MSCFFIYDFGEAGPLCRGSQNRRVVDAMDDLGSFSIGVSIGVSIGARNGVDAQTSLHKTVPVEKPVIGFRQSRPPTLRYMPPKTRCRI